MYYLITFIFNVVGKDIEVKAFIDSKQKWSLLSYDILKLEVIDCFH